MFRMKNKKILLFGGTFDPVHLGHTTVAQAAVEYIGAERIIFIPAKRSPLKSAVPRASDMDRLKMLSLAVEGREKYEVSDYEINMPAPSYTVDTVRHFQSFYGDEIVLYWLVGADSIDDLVYWYRITELIDACKIAMMYRAAYEKPDFTKYKSVWGNDRVEKLQKNVIPTPLVDISSTQVRTRLASGEDVAQMLDVSVLSYIIEHRLYVVSPQNRS